MLAMYFVHEGAIRAGDGVDEWRLKRHAEQEFWEWVSTWALVYSSPADLGFDEPGYKLPELRRHLIEVEAQREAPKGQFFADGRMSLRERIGTRKATVLDRAKAAADLVNASPDDAWLIWCGRNDEAAELERLIPSAKQVSGSMDRTMKADRLIGFVTGKPKDLITKPSIAGFGMNWQHCHKMVFVGLNDSFEQLYQAIRRCWRFGQKHPVDVYLVSSTAEYAVLKNVMDKERKQERLYASVSALSRAAVHGEKAKAGRIANITETKIKVPEWLR
jgi:hypothetical protein